MLREPCKTLVGAGIASGSNRAHSAAMLALRSPLLNGIDMACAQGIFVMATAAKDTLLQRELRAAMQPFYLAACDGAIVLTSVAYDESLGDQLRVTVIATGVAG